MAHHGPTLNIGLKKTVPQYGIPIQVYRTAAQFTICLFMHNKIDTKIN